MRLIARRAFGCSVLLLLACWTSLVHAAAPITPSGLNTKTSDPFLTAGGKTQYDITGGTRPGGGLNLFHSFGDFNVPTNNIANFLNDSGLPTSNILGRVTGGNASSIFGMIQTTGFGNANLFLMNPYGFLFGPSATLNVGGMVAFTTANYLRFQGTETVFDSASTPQSLSLLTSAPVAAFGFLGADPAAIAIQGSTLQVAQGKSLSLVGGNKGFTATDPDNGQAIEVPGGITMTGGKLLAPGGQINIASVASPGEVVAGTLAYAPNVNGQSFGALGSINISQQSIIDVNGNGGGTVSIRGGQLVLDNSTISANVTGPGPVIDGAEAIGHGIDIQVSQDAIIQNGALIDASVVANATHDDQYGGVNLKGDHIEVRGIADFDAGNFVFTTIQANVGEAIVGNSGNITLEGNSILVKDAGQIQTVTNGAGNAGNITLKANQTLDIITAVVSSAAQQTFDEFGNIKTRATGNSGNMDLISVHGDISLTGFSIVTSQTVESPGTVGNITMNALEGNILMVDSGFFTYMQPPLNAQGVRAIRAEGSGEVRISANTMQMNGGTIDVINLSAQPAGDVRVTLAGRLSLAGGTFGPSHIQAASVGLLDGSPGAPSAGLNIMAHDIIITDGSSMNTDTTGPGAAGSLNISAINLELRNGGKITSSARFGFDPQTGLPVDFAPTGSAGTVNVQGLNGPAQSVLIDGTGSGIFTDTQGAGAGGNIVVNANNVTLQRGGTLSAKTSGTEASATGGTITVNAEQVTLGRQAVITADTNGIAPAGTVDINTGTLAINSGSQIRSSSGAEQPIVTALEAAPALNGGSITVQGRDGASSQAGNVTIDGSGSGIFTQSTGNRPGGDINIVTSGSVTMTNGASISASSTGTGIAGDITINAGNQFSMTNSTVTTEALHSSGGAIKITTTPSGTVQLTDSTISASVLDGTGGGGSVNIDPQFVILQNSQILAKAVDGPGGNIFITTNLLMPDGNSTISASSQFGQQGTVTIQSPGSPASGKIVPLSQKPLIAATLLSQRCAAVANGKSSSFTVVGRDTLPAEPSGWLLSPLALSGDGFPGSSALSSLSGSKNEPNQTNQILSLRRIAPPGFLTQNFAVDSAGCTS